jgi:hypothetical protein
MSVAYHLWLDEAAKGPFTIGQLRAMWNRGQITTETNYTVDAGESWHHLADIISDLEPTPISTPPAKTEVLLVHDSQPRSNTDLFKWLCWIWGIGILGIGIYGFLSLIPASHQQTLDALNSHFEANLAKTNEAAMANHMARTGMTKEDVLRSLGRPYNKIDVSGQSPNLKEIWQYNGDNSVSFNWNDEVCYVSDKINFEKTDQFKQMSHQSVSNLMNSSNNP